ncbi:MAG: NAD(P)H-dependent oxidoreductase [Lutibacter sp.]|uniref:NADPH-dependent FMN reductase n=1 Tax=Lutibacter sp. TaxID=1925666 RepID=UPI00385D81A0
MNKRVVTIGGSNSKKSISKQLAEYAGSLIHNVEIINIDLNDFSLPVFSVDIEEEDGIPKDANKLNAIIESADGFVIALAEHNGAYSVAFKNVLDWLSRIEGKVWRDKPMLLLATSPGARGGQTVLDIALGRFPYMGGENVRSMSFPSFFDNFIEGEIVNEALKLNLLKLVEDYQKEI